MHQSQFRLDAPLSTKHLKRERRFISEHGTGCDYVFIEINIQDDDTCCIGLMVADNIDNPECTLLEYNITFPTTQFSELRENWRVSSHQFWTLELPARKPLLTLFHKGGDSAHPIFRTS